MAELDDKLLKNLDKTLESMNERLLTLETTLSGVKNGLNKTFDPSIITSFADAIRGLKMLRLIDAEGATKDIQKVKDKIDELEAKWKGDKPLRKGESFAGIADELARYKALMKDIQKGSEQRTVELANAAKKEADAVEAEERRKQREFQATANEQAKLLKAYSDIEQARSVVTGGKKFGELDAEQTKKYKEFGRTLDELKKKMDDLEKTSPGSKAAGTQIFKEQEAITKAKREAAEEQTRIKKEQAEQERRINEAIKEEERKRAENNRRVLEDEKKALADYIRLFSEKQRLLKEVAPLDAKDIRHTGMTEQQRALYDVSWNRINAINAEMDKLRSNYVSVLEYEEKIQANGQEQVALSKVRLTQEQALSKEKERQAKSETKQQNDEAKIQRQADAIVKKRIDLERQVQRIDNDRAIRQQTNSKISQQALDAESRKYEALLQRINQLNNALSKLEGKQAGVTAKAEQRNAPYMNYVAAAEEERKAKAIENSTKKLKEQKNTLDSMLPTVQRLASAFGIAFSVRGLAQFGKKLIETRGEFEMQFVAMKQIIGDVDAATKIWNQTMQQALQSPKTFKELVTYTKQLAAYRIETEKLFDTTKRLADVSAGLGVDMSRLILAYGQVKSANFLRASEVRQFTEAGVNIVGNLAKYFTELEGRAVGTAEVMERITKRMVLFSDVEAIFKRMTDEGGEFYNMQEVQADTVKGQIMKLHDAYDQMLNTIGQANQGTIRNFVDTLNNLVRNWQNVAFVLKANINWITIFGASLYALSNRYMKGATTQTLWFSKALTGNEKVLLKEAGAVRLFGNEVGLLSVKQRIGVIAMRTFQGAVMAVGKALSMLWPLLVFEGITLLVERLTRANRELKRFKEELQEVASTNVGQMDEEINGYDSLIERLKRTTEGTMARKEVLDEISRRYGKYLDFIITEKTTVEELAGAYDKVVSSIRNYTAEKIREEQQQRLEKGMYDEYQDLVKNLTGARLDIGGQTRKISSQQAKNLAKIIQEQLEENGVLSPKDIQDILSTYFGETVYAAVGGSNTNILKYVGEYQNDFLSLKEKLQEIRDDIEGSTPVFASEAEYEQYIKNVEDANKEIAAQNDLYQQQVDLVNQKTEEQWKIEDEIARLRLENEEKVLQIRKEYGLISEGQYNDELARLHGRLDTYETDYNKRLAKAMAESYGELWQTENKEARDMYNYVVSTEQALAQGTTQRNKQLIDTYKGLKDSLEQYKKALEAALASGAEQAAIAALQANIDTTVLHMTAIEEYAAVLRGLDLSDKKNTPRGRQENASKLISLIKEMRSEYDRLAKSAYGYAKSEERVREAYRDSVKAILEKAGVTEDYDFTTNEGMIAALDKVLAYAKKLGPEAAAEVQKYIDQLETEIEINAQVKIRNDFGKQIEEMFSNYDLTIDLEKLNVPTDELVGIFNLDVTTLDELRRFVDDFYNKQIELGNNPTELVEQVDGYYKKIDDLEKRELRKRLETYSKYLAEGQVEALRIHLEELKKMAELDELYQQGYFTDTQYKDISNKIRKEIDEELAKNEWLRFKESDFYVTMFEDMSRVSSESIDIMIKRLKSLRKSVNDLNPKQAKEIVKAIEKLEKVQLERSPLKSFLEDWKTAAKWRKDNDNLVKQLEFYASGDEYWSKEQDEQARRVAELRLEYEELVRNGTPEDAADVKKRLDFEEEELSRINEILEDRRQKLDQINQELNEGYAAQQRVLAGLSQGAQYFSDLASTVGTISTEIMDMFDGVSEASKQLSKDIAEIAANVGILAGDIVKAIASEGTDVGSMIDGLVRTWNIIKGIFSASEYEINYTIEKSTDALKDLEFELERVRRARERAWDTHAFTLAQKEIETNIYEQIEAYDALISAEEERKNKDEEQIRTWTQEREELFDLIEDERENLLKEFGGLGESEYKSAAQDFVDAWKSAFLETGDGLQGLQDHFDEFLNEWFVKQATMRVAGRMLEPLFRQIDSAVDQYGSDGANVLMQELQNVREKFGVIAPRLSEALEELAGTWGLGGEGALSGLAAGIQGMTEEQANILEAYWNSVRGYTASIDMNVARIAEMLGAGGVNTNPQLQQLNLIAANTQATHQLLQSVTKSGHPQGGYGIKVFAD